MLDSKFFLYGCQLSLQWIYETIKQWTKFYVFSDVLKRRGLSDDGGFLWQKGIHWQIAFVSGAAHVFTMETLAMQRSSACSVFYSFLSSHVHVVAFDVYWWTDGWAITLDETMMIFFVLVDFLSSIRFPTDITVAAYRYKIHHRSHHLRLAVNSFWRCHCFDVWTLSDMSSSIQCFSCIHDVFSVKLC